MKKVLLFLGILLISAILYVGGMIVFGLVTKFKPAPEEAVETSKPASGAETASIINDSTVSLMIWNIGYGGLGKEVDFFYDGGKMVVSPKEHVAKNNVGIEKFLATQKDVDFVMLQEVDRKGKRSWNTDQYAANSATLAEHNSTYAVNYDVKYLPFPYTSPLGRIYSGLQTLCRYTPVESKRISLPGITDFPRKVFYLERCLLLQRFKVANGKELVIVNAHFEAYDKGGIIKKQQREVTKKILEDEYAKGNYVILGGDWNIAPPDFNVHTWEKTKNDDPLYLMNNDSVYIEGWSYVYDGKIATNRKNLTPYTEGETFKTVIDYYCVSPNVEVQEVKGVEMGFDFSDHQPVKLLVKLK